MNAIEGWLGGLTAQPRVHAVLHAIYNFLLPLPFVGTPGRRGYGGAGVHHAKASVFHSLALLIPNGLERMLHSCVWFIVLGFAIFVWYTAKARRPGESGFGQARYSYALPMRQPTRAPGERFSLVALFQYLFPKSFYTHTSVKVDAKYWPISLVLGFFGLLGVTAGTAVVQGWLLHRFGPSPITIPAGGVAIALQVVIILLARDFGHYMWHYQGHKVPFFWEFHKGHHTVEVLHPFFIRTHPVDMFIRNTYMGAGGGLIAGSLIYLGGMRVSLEALSIFAGISAVFATLSEYEHTHIRISFGKALNRILYYPGLHQFHHGAKLEHRDVNLGITGGLVLWDRLFGTLYEPRPGELTVWGSSMEELGENNPHRTLRGFLFGPFMGAIQVLRGRMRPSVGGATGSTAGTTGSSSVTA